MRRVRARAVLSRRVALGRAAAVAVCVVACCAGCSIVERESPHPTRTLDASAMPVADRFMRAMFDRNDCSVSARDIDPSVRFYESAKCNRVDKRIVWHSTRVGLRHGCGEGFGSQLVLKSPFDCLRYRVSGRGCGGLARAAPTLFKKEGVMNVFMRRVHAVWKVDLTGALSEETQLTGHVCTAAERATMPPIVRR